MGMMDGISSAGGTAVGGAADPRIATVVRTGPVAAAVPVATPTPTPTPSSVPEPQQLAALAKAVAANAPVDTDRVAQIKEALANGTFPILPATIADQMLSFRYEWMSNDPKSQD